MPKKPPPIQQGFGKNRYRASLIYFPLCSAITLEWDERVYQIG